LCTSLKNIGRLNLGLDSVAVRFGCQKQRKGAPSVSAANSPDKLLSLSFHKTLAITIISKELMLEAGREIHR